MSYLLDTNVLSELLRKTPNANVVGWIESVPQDTLHISVLTLGEFRKGIAKLANGKKKAQLNKWLEHELPEWFEDRVITIDKSVADKWGLIMAAKKPVPAIDGLLAATALAHNLKMVTRNISDFQIEGLEVINPWD